MKSVPKAVVEAAALWASSFIYVDARGNYRWSRKYGVLSDRHDESAPLPRVARGAVASKIIPQNKAVKEYLAEQAREGKVHVITDRQGRVHELDYSLHEVADDLGFIDLAEARARVLGGRKAR